MNIFLESRNHHHKTIHHLSDLANDQAIEPPIRHHKKKHHHSRQHNQRTGKKHLAQPDDLN